MCKLITCKPEEIFFTPIISYLQLLTELLCTHLSHFRQFITLIIYNLSCQMLLYIFGYGLLLLDCDRNFASEATTIY